MLGFSRSRLAKWTWGTDMGIGMAAAMAGLMLAGAGADGDDFAFDLFNDTKVAVTQLNTKLPNGKWSSNWLKVRVGPGISTPLRFTDPNDTRCEIQTRVTFADGSYFDDTVSYCNKDTLMVTNDEMTTM